MDCERFLSCISAILYYVTFAVEQVRRRCPDALEPHRPAALWRPEWALYPSVRPDQDELEYALCMLTLMALCDDDVVDGA